MFGPEIWPSEYVGKSGSATLVSAFEVSQYMDATNYFFPTGCTVIYEVIFYIFNKSNR